jgi:hypothetical protein
MHRQLRLLLVGLFAFAVVGCGSNADDAKNADGTCARCACYEADTWTSGYDAVTVPRNPRVLVPATSTQLISLRASDGTELQIYQEEAGVDGLVWVRPRELLDAGATYDIRVSDANADVGAPIMSLHAQQELDATPLTVSGVALAATTSSDICDLQLGARLSVTTVKDDGQADRRVYADIELTIDDKQTHVILPFLANGQAQSADFGAGSSTATNDAGTSSDAGVSPASCLLARYVPGVTAATSGKAKVVFYDLGGNATVLANTLDLSFGGVTSETCPVSDSKSSGGGCSTIATPSTDITSLSFWLVSALLVSWRSRSRRARAGAPMRSKREASRAA